MKKILVGLLFLTNICFANSDKGVLVAISAYDGRQAAEYYGVISKEKYNTITTGLTEFAMLKIDDVFWINNEGKIERMSTSHRNGHKFGYTNTIFLREEYITRVVVLDAKYLSTLKEK